MRSDLGQHFAHAVSNGTRTQWVPAPATGFRVQIVLVQNGPGGQPTGRRVRKIGSRWYYYNSPRNRAFGRGRTLEELFSNPQVMADARGELADPDEIGALELRARAGSRLSRLSLRWESFRATLSRFSRRHVAEEG